MDRILVLVDEDRTRSLLEQWLSVQYQVHLADSVHQLDASFELCIVDRLALRRLGPRLEAWRARQEPALLPLLLVTSRRAIPEISEHVWQLVDELIVNPLDSVELQARIARLLHTRQLSLELRHNRETLIRVRKAIESTSDAISVADMDGTALYHNQAFYALYGYSVNDLNLRGIAQTLFVHPDVAENIFASARAGNSWSGEVVLRRKGGQLMPTLLRADSIENDSGRRIGLVAVYTDKNRIREVDASERPQRILAEALRDIVAAVNSTLELDQVLMLILAYVGRVVPFDAASIMLVDKGEASVAAHVGCESGDLDHRYVVREQPLLAHMAATGQPVLIQDAPEQGTPAFMPASGHLSYLGAPIRIRDECIGFIHLSSTLVGFFAGAHAERLQTFGQLVGTAIENARLYERAQELARIKERQRIARDLHDAVSQTLFSANAIAEALPRLWARDPASIVPRLDQLQRLTRGALAEMRTLLVELRPTALLETSLSDLLESLAVGVMGRSRTRVDLEVRGAASHSLPSEAHEAIYYITQEALNNVVKHARAARIWIVLHLDEHGASLQIRDDGRGFDPTTVPATSMGLQIMRERAEAIGAQWQVVTRKGQGTTITVDWAVRSEVVLHE